MRNKKIIGLSVAALGAIVVTSTSYALYTKKSADKSFDITIQEHTEIEGTVQYQCGKINTTGGEGIEHRLNPNNPTVTHTIPLKAIYPEGVPVQDKIAGNITVTQTKNTENLYDISAKIVGYQENTYGKTHYGTDNLILGTGKDITVLTDGTQQLQITVSLTQAAKENFIEHDSKDYQLNVNWTEVSENFTQAYIYGDGNGWKTDKAYKMVEEINSKTDRLWGFNGLKGFTLMKFWQDNKAKTETKYIGDKDGNNFALLPDQTYYCRAVDSVWTGDGKSDIVVDNNLHHVENEAEYYNK